MIDDMSNGFDPTPLQVLGFTEIEALVYGYLVENSPATGYRISHAKALFLYSCH